MAETDYGYTYEGAVQVGKFSVVKQESATYKDGFVLTAAAAAPYDLPLGVIQDGIYPHGGSDYNKGVYTGISNSAWPANVTPATPVGQKRSIRISGRSQCVAAGAIARGQRVAAVNALGQVGSVEGLAAGTKVNILGVADTSCANVGDIVYVIVLPRTETV